MRHISGDRYKPCNGALYFGRLHLNPSFSLLCFTSAGWPHPRGAARVGEYPPAKAGTAGGHSGIIRLEYRWFCNVYMCRNKHSGLKKKIQSVCFQQSTIKIRNLIKLDTSRLKGLLWHFVHFHCLRLQLWILYCLTKHLPVTVVQMPFFPQVDHTTFDLKWNVRYFLPRALFLRKLVVYCWTICILKTAWIFFIDPVKKFSLPVTFV